MGTTLVGGVLLLVLTERSAVGFLDRISGLPAPTSRNFRPYSVTNMNVVLGQPLEFPDGLPPGLTQISFGMGCFWGAEKKFWQVPAVFSTSVGYQGGNLANSTYDEVCTGKTGHAEVVQVTYDPAKVTPWDLLAVFWENHDPTQGNRQGNDVGSQYRSAIYVADEEQLRLAQQSEAEFAQVLTKAGLGAITTDIELAEDNPYYLAEDYHQQYLHKVPHGYDCHSSTGMELPPLNRN